MKLSCFWHVQKYITDRYKYMSVEEQSIWASNLENINNQLREAYKNGLSNSPVSYFLSFETSCIGCVELNDEVE